MPYIKKERRLELTKGLSTPQNAGELNYLLTYYLIDYLKYSGWNGTGDLPETTYQKINDIVGALEGAKAEFYRRVAVPYEKSKIKSNGDVY